MAELERDGAPREGIYEGLPSDVVLVREMSVVPFHLRRKERGCPPKLCGRLMVPYFTRSGVCSRNPEASSLEIEQSSSWSLECTLLLFTIDNRELSCGPGERVKVLLVGTT